MLTGGGGVFIRSNGQGPKAWVSCSMEGVMRRCIVVVSFHSTLQETQRTWNIGKEGDVQFSE